MSVPAPLLLRAIDPTEAADWVASVVVPFFEQGNAQAIEHWQPHLESGRTWAISDHGRFVANCCVFSREVTVPSGPVEVCPSVPMAAISGVGVHPSHRRRGLLTSMMDIMLADAIEREEPLAGLLASEGSIYGRFGFGLANFNAQYRLEARRGQFLRAPPPIELHLIDTDQARDVLPALHDVARRQRPGDLSRNAAAWADEWNDPVARRDGASASYRAVTPGGFVSYRVKRHSVDDIEQNQLTVYDLYATTPDIEAALWRFVLDVDLVGEVTAWRRPTDDQLRWWLADPRQLRTSQVSDMLWVRPLHVPAVLGARGYLREGRLVLDVRPPGVALLGGDPAVGRFVLDAGPDGASCRLARPNEAPDVVLGVAELGSVLLGGVKPSALARARRIEVSRPGAIDVMDGLFASSVAPFCGTNF